MPLSRVIDQARRLGARGTVVFDLDSTLLDNRPRQARILREYGQAHGLAVLAACRPEHWVSWSIRTAMRNAGLDAADVDLHTDPARAFWRERFFTSEYCVDDVPIRGAIAYVRAVREAGALVLYVTGRHEGMRHGTVACFERHGFLPPDGAGVRLLMKPRLEESDDTFKLQAQAPIRALGAMIAAFDNEPAHANGYREGFPEAIVVRLDTDHSGRPIPLLPGIEVVPHFEGSAAR